MAITTRNSIKVKPNRIRQFVEIVGIARPDAAGHEARHPTTELAGAGR